MQEEFMVPKERCEVTHSQTIYNTYNIMLDGPIQEPEYYRDAYQVLRDAQEGDRVNIFVNSPGGLVTSAIGFINLIRDSAAEVVAFIEGECHSAASMISLVCNGIVVKPYCSMLIHNASFGTYNTAQNVRDHVTFTTTQTERLIRDVYDGFLTEDEIEEVIRNREIWLSDEEINERLEKKFVDSSDEECNTLPTHEEMIENAVAKAFQKQESLKTLNYITEQDQKLGLYDDAVSKEELDFEILNIDKFNTYIEK